MENSISFCYQKPPCNDDSEVHVAFRCSDEYAIYAPVSIYSILINNTNKYSYIYIFTDSISDSRWEKILNISKLFDCCEVFKIVPESGDIQILKEMSNTYHGWWMIHVSVFYQKYLPLVDRVFSLGIDSFCVGDLSLVSRKLDENNHFLGSCNRHQNDLAWYSLSPLWIGFDGSFINLKKMRQDEIGAEQLINFSVDRVGYIHDEVAYNGLCKRQFIDSKFIYVYSGSYLPNRTINENTVIVDYYCIFKPWQISIAGYEVFDLYIDYYNYVNNAVDLEYDLPISRLNAIHRLFGKGYPLIDLASFAIPIFGIHLYRLASLGRSLIRRLKLLF